MAKTIDVLIFSEPNDVHAIAVRDALLETHRRVSIISTADIPEAIGLSMSPSAGRAVLLAPDGEIDLAAIRGIWWRRPEPHRVSQHLFHPRLVDFAQAETRTALLGLLFGLNCNFINPVERSRRAAYKPLQLSLARAVGLDIPETLICNCPEEIERFFVQHHGDAIYKTLTTVDFGMFETRRLTPGDLHRRASLCICPIIVQEFVHGPLDIRATIVGDQVFAAESNYEPERSPVDSRLHKPPFRRHCLPQSTAAMLIEFVRRMGLVYSAIDLRMSASGKYVFFESNPEGQYLYTEIEADLPISRALAARLLR